MEESSEYSHLKNNAPLDVPYTTIPEMIRRHSQRDSESVAQVFINWKTFEKEYLTYTDIYQSSSTFARGLMKIGINKEDIVALVTEDIPEWTSALVGIQMCGAIPLMFTFNLNDGSDVISILTKAGEKCRAIIFTTGADSNHISIVNNICQRGVEKGRVECSSFRSLTWGIMMAESKSRDYLTIDEISNMGGDGAELPVIDPEDVAAIFRTSGSTGTPKLIPHSHYAILITGWFYALGYGLSNKTLYNDRLFSWMAGFPSWEIFTSGTRILIKHLLNIPSGREFFKVYMRVMKEEKFDTTLVISQIFNELIADDTAAWKLNHVVTSGEPIPRMFTRAASKSCNKLVIRYGSSEITSASFVEIDKEKEYLDYDAGRSLPGVELKVVNSDGVLLKRGERGELWIRSPIRFAGYMNDEEKTNDVLTATGWYKTGDSAWITGYEHLIVEGRLSDSLFVASDRTQPLALWEGKLKQHPAVRNAVVVVYVDDRLYKGMCIAVMPKAGVQVSAEELVNHLLDSSNRSNDIYHNLIIPRNIVFFESFPTTHTGKVNRKEVANICKEKMAGKRPFDLQ